jgi:hypothetical protein
MITALAWMTIQASMTLAALLTVILLPWAMRSLVLLGTVLELVRMTWRVEAWKAACLEAGRQLSERQPPQQPPILPSTTSFDVDSPIRSVALALPIAGCLLPSHGHPNLLVPGHRQGSNNNLSVP